MPQQGGTALAVIREGAEASGYTVQGFAPSSKAAGALRDAGVEAKTLQSFLASKQPDPETKHLYMLDESSLASSKQMRGFLEKIGPNDRVLVIGDTRQHQAVDRVQLTAPSTESKLANRELGTVEGISEGRMALKMDDGRSVEIDPAKHPHLDHGYAVTSHSSQGQTADRVLIHVDTELGAKDLLNNRMAYVAVSRGAHDAQLFTNDREKLPVALGHEVSQQSAHVPEVARVPASEVAPKHEHSYGFGISM